MSATSPETKPVDLFPDELDDKPMTVSPLWLSIQQGLAPIASLKLTVALLAFGVAIIFIGTLAQTKADIWEVMTLYFRAWYTWVPFAVFVPPAFFPNTTPPGGSFLFPGGATIGSLMLINLFAAHLVRFKAQPWSVKTAWGWGIFALGCVLTLYVVFGMNAGAGVQDRPLLPLSLMWYGFLASIVLVCGGAWTTAIYALNSGSQTRSTLTLALGSAVVAVGATIGLAFIALCPEQARLGESSLRIVWQLLQGGVAGVVLMFGCWMVFAKRAGIVVIHGGIALMMLGEAMVSWNAVESQMDIREGQTVNFSQDIRTTELAFIDASDPKFNEETVIPLKHLLQSEKDRAPISNALLPVNVQVVEYFRNSEMRRVKPDDKNPATAGSGLAWLAETRKAGTGTDMDSKVDLSAAYIRLTNPKTKAELGTYLVSIIGTKIGEPERIEVDGKKYDVALRFKHYYKPYTVTLDEVRQDTYVGTNTPKNYSSDIQLADPSRQVNLKAHIWMNNPLRYGGETFYQNSYREGPEGKETTLAVVSNTGWMIPYVSCMLVAIGMGYHFILALSRYLNRVSRAETVVEAPSSRPSKKAAVAPAPRSGDEWGLASWLFIGGATLVFLAFVGRIAVPPKSKPGEFDLQTFGTTSVVHEGRVKPMDTLARVMLRIVSNQETFKDSEGKRQPALRWMLDLISRSEQGLEHRVIRIEHPQVLALFNLEDRPGSYRYSINELRKNEKNYTQFIEQQEKASEKKPDSLTPYERKILELANRLKAVLMLQHAFTPPPVPKLPPIEKIKTEPEAFNRWRMEFASLTERVNEMKVPLVIPLENKEQAPARAKGSAKDGWASYPASYLDAFVEVRLPTIFGLPGQKGDEALMAFNELLDAYGEGRDAEYQIAEAAAKKETADPKVVSQRDAAVQAFARKTIEFQDLAAKRRPASYDPETAKLETYFNHMSLFFQGIWLYFIGFVLVALSWLTGQRKTIGAAAATLITLTFALHCVAMLMRMYISGRPPVTNLYSSALFIGLGCVAFGLVMELLFGRGFGLLASAVSGFSTLWIAWLLSMDGDTMTVLQAVLDTQFWLATHVTCITLGYSATFLAGVFGMISIFRRLPGGPLLFNRYTKGAALSVLTWGLVLVPEDSRSEEEVNKDLARMTYGTLCFALFFSFVGTVLGGLWADDSWGRFWGWDPKENGALMIVLWNAIILHARWDKMIAERGLAILAVLGNIVTAWSWFGVNELGVGLHSYGFTEGRLFYLGMVILAHLIIAGVGVVSAIVARMTPRETMEPVV